MRVLLSRKRSDTDERGAVALLVGILAVALCMVSAFVVDLGQSYVSTRQLQTAADAAALAAAQEYVTSPGTCPQLLLLTAVRAKAQAAADSHLTRNRPGATTQAITPTCNAEGELEVTYTTTGTTPVTFGKLAGVGNTLSTTRSATAVVDVPPSAVGGKPLALCSEQVPKGAPEGVWKEIRTPGKGHSGSDCPAGENGGNWWFNTCDIEGGGTTQGSPANTGKAIENGCTSEIGVVPNQDPSSPAKLSQSLTANCKAGSPATPSCLDADTGNSNWTQKDAYEAWATILGEPSIFPVFCSVTECDPDTSAGKGGTNVRYPVYRLAAAVVCGVHTSKADYRSDTGACAGNPYSEAYMSGLDKGENILFVKYTKVSTSGTTRDATCALGAAECDSGLRRVHLAR